MLFWSMKEFLIYEGVFFFLTIWSNNAMNVQNQQKNVYLIL